MTRRTGESGNIFFTLFGAIALVGVVGVATSTLMRGPVGTVLTLNQRAKIESQLQIARKLAALEAAQVSNNCDADSFLEPLDPDTATPGCAGLITGGGCLPTTVGAAKTDPWGTLVGYCGWDHGPTVAGCGSLNAGVNNQSNVVLAVISAGPDRTFQSTCGADPAYVTTAGDDLVFEWTYDEASEGLGGGLWALKSGDPTRMTPTKDLDDVRFASGTTATFDNAAASFGAGSRLDLGAGGLFNLPNEIAMATCNAPNKGILRRQTNGGPDEILQICDGTTWQNVGSIAGGTAAAGNEGEVQFNSGGILYSVPGFFWDKTNSRLGVGVGAPNDTLDVAGTAQVTGAVQLDSTLGVTGVATLSNNATVGGTLGVTGAATFSSTTHGVGAADFDNTFNADGAATLGSTLDVTGAATFNSTTHGVGAADFDSTLNVDGAATFQTTTHGVGAADFDSTLNVDGNTTLGGTLGVTGAATLSNTLSVSGNVSDPDSDVTINDGLDIIGAARLRDLGSGQVAGGSCVPGFLPGAITFDGVNDELLLCSAAAGNTWVTVGTSGGGGGGSGSKWTDGAVGIYRLSNVGVGIDPTERFQVAGNVKFTSGNAYLVGGDFALVGTHTGTSAVPVTGAGTRIMFHDKMSAFRAGAVTGTQWDNASIGAYSVAMGLDTVAAGAQSFAFGKEVRANAANSIALGMYSGAPATDPAVGAIESMGIFMGNQNAVNLNTSHILLLAGGRMVIDPGAPATQTNVSGILDLDVEGQVGAIQYCDENGANCFYASDVSGGTITAPGNDREIVFNSGGVLGTDGAFLYLSSGDFVVGSTQLADDGNAAHDARMFFDKSKGAFRAGSVTGTQWDDANVGNGSAAFGADVRASGTNSFAAGGAITADGLYSVALGRNLATGGNYSMVMGNAVRATSTHSFGIGLGIPAGVFPEVSGASSIGIFMGDQSGVNVSANNTMALLGGSFVIGGTAASAGAQTLEMDVNGDIGATNYCDASGNNCFTAASVGTANAHGVDNNIQFNSAGGLWSNNNFVFTSAGRLGVGTAAPSGKLSIEAATTTTPALTIKTTDNGGLHNMTRWLDSSGSTRLSVAVGAAASTLSFNSDAYIVGVTAAPSNLYYRAASHFFGSRDGLYDGVQFNTEGNNPLAVFQHRLTGYPTLVLKDVASQTANLLEAQNSAGAVLSVITANGYIGINDTTPDSGTGGQLMLDVNGNIGGINYCYEAGNNCFTASDVASGNTGAPGNDREMVFNSGGVLGTNSNFVFTSAGRLGIGTAAPTSRLTVTGTDLSATPAVLVSAGSLRVNGQDNNGYQVVLGSNGSIFTTGSGAFSSSGDMRVAAGWGDLSLDAMSGGAGAILFKINNAEVGRIAPSGNVIFSSSTGALTLHSGTTAQRPGTPVNGMIRYNGQTNRFEAYENGAWTNMIAGAGSLAIDDLTDALADYATEHNIIMGRTGAAALTAGAQYNLFIGEGAGATTANSTATTDGNTAIGFSALNALTSGVDNVAVGTNALLYNTSGGNNTANGTGALYFNVTGSNNVALGYRSLQYNVGKQESTAVGYYAMRYADSAVGGTVTYNTALGAYALQGSVTAASNTGTQNTAIGHSAMIANTSGGQNTAIGNSALAPNTTGSFNTAIGASSLVSNNSANHNTAIGHQSLQNATGGNNTAIGSVAGNTITSGTSNIMIGYNTQPPTAATSNYLNIGGAIYGDMATGNIVVAGTAALTVPTGTTAQRPGAPVNGMIRYNGQTNRFEGYENGVWTNMIAGAGSLAIDDLTDALTDYVTDHNVIMGRTGAAAYYWLLGVPDPAGSSVDLPPEPGSATRGFEQQGWQVRFREYVPWARSSWSLPRRLEISSGAGRARARLVVERWQEFRP